MVKIAGVIKGKCPNCKKGDIFETKGNIFLLRMPKMHKRCSVCDLKYEKETGFFFGAMFVSYALAVAEMVASLVIFWSFMDMAPLQVFMIVAFMAILTSTFNFRISRAIWIYLFN